VRQFGGLVAALLALTAAAAGAQDVTGTWQGTLSEQSRSTRLLLQLAREGDGRLTAALYNLDQGGFGAPAVAFTAVLDRGTLRASFARGAFEGRVSGRAATMLTGTWTPLGGRGSAPAQPLTFTRPTAATAWRDNSMHRVRFVRVAPDVQLEVLDWGGPTAEPGRRVPPIVLLTGAGTNAHVFDDFAPKLAAHYHVYGITRRGFAPSSIATSGYLADSLADDVLTVLDSLGLTGANRPVLVGHSIAGEELSSIGSRHPERVAGLAYVEAGFPYAFYDPAQENATYVIPDVQRQLAVIFDRWAPISYAERAAMIRSLADSTLPILQRDLRTWAQDLDKAPNASVRPTGIRRDPVASALFAGAQRYTTIKGPVLAIYAAPRPLPPNAPSDSAARARMDSVALAGVLPQITAFQRGVPQSRVVRLAHATHYVFRSNESDVLRELQEFISALPHASGTDAPAIITRGSSALLAGIRFHIGTAELPAPAQGTLGVFEGTVEFAAGRGRLDVIARTGRPPIAVRGVTVNPPIASSGDYYLFDSTGFVLVQPTNRTFSTFALSESSFRLGDVRDPREGFMEFSPLHADTLAANDSGRLTQHGPYTVRWHLDRRQATGPARVLARGWIELPDAPAGEASVVRWFGAAAVLASMRDGFKATSPDSLRVTAAIVLPTPGSGGSGATGAPLTLIVLHSLAEVATAGIDPARLVLPQGFSERPWPGFERAARSPTSLPGAAARWRTMLSAAHE
jgi:pimeloyl-ACP methyl ester carboxylesterase